MAVVIKPISRIVEEFTEYARKERGGIFTMNWDKFARLVDRVQFKEAFLKKVQEKLQENDVLITYGKNVVVIVDDKHFEV